MMAKYFLVFVSILACVEFLVASPTRRQTITITEASASDQPVTNEWDDSDNDNDEFDLDGQNWYSQAVVSPSTVPKKLLDYNDYDDDYSNRGNDNAMKDFGSDDNNDDDDEDDSDVDKQDAEEDVENNANDSEFSFVPSKDTRLILEDDDDDQTGPIKVRHTGRSSYSKVPEVVENSIESTEDDNKEDDEHPYEFAIDEDDKIEDGDDDDDDEDPHKAEDIEVSPRREHHEDNDDEDEFVSEAEDNDLFENPEEDAAQVIYGDHVFLY